VANILLNTLSTDQQSFRLNCNNLLTFAHLAFEKGYYTVLQSSDPKGLESSSFPADTGALASSATETANLKDMILAVALMPLFEYDFDAAFSFVQQCDATEPPGLQAQEGYAPVLASQVERRWILSFKFIHIRSPYEPIHSNLFDTGPAFGPCRLQRAVCRSGC
jgi:hypothetical protein